MRIFLLSSLSNKKFIVFIVFIYFVKNLIILFRRRNSSVKDLIKKMEAEAKRRIVSLPSFEVKSSTRKPSRISEEPPLYANIDDIDEPSFQHTRTVSEPVPSILIREQVFEFFFSYSTICLL